MHVVGRWQVGGSSQTIDNYASGMSVVVMSTVDMIAVRTVTEVVQRLIRKFISSVLCRLCSAMLYDEGVV